MPGVEFHPTAPLSHFGNSFLQQVGGPLSKREIPPLAPGAGWATNPRALVQMPYTLIVRIGTSVSAGLSYTKASLLQGSTREGC